MNPNRTGPSKTQRRKQRQREANQDKRSLRQKRDPAPPKQKFKVVVRLLPPEITEEQFRTLCEPWKSSIDWKRFALEPPLERPGPMYSRAYLKFLAPVDQNVRLFHVGFPKALADEAGKVYKVQVEYSLYQKVVENRKSDHRMGSIFEDKDYKAFLGELEKADEPVETKPVSGVKESASEVGALVSFLKQRHDKRAARRQRRNRNGRGRGKPDDGGKPKRKRRRRRPRKRGKGGGGGGPPPKIKKKES